MAGRLAGGDETASPRLLGKNMSESAGAAAPNGQLKVLIVEDDKFLHRILLTKFQKEGFEVRGALDGETALRTLKEWRPSVFLLDLILPKMNGFEVLSEIKTDPKTADLPVVILSNLSQAEDRERTGQMGAIGFLVKADISINDVVVQVKETAKLLTRRH